MHSACLGGGGETPCASTLQAVFIFASTLHVEVEVNAEMPGKS
jgi:hypothetical protein